MENLNSRRNIIKVIGGASIFAAVGGCATGGSSMPAIAIEGWQGPKRAETDPRRRALSYALLAPNPHNMQSWIADLRDPKTVRLFVDRSRLLPMTDPYSRQIIIGCGCFLETMRLAALKDGQDVTIAYFPQGEDAVESGLKPFAEITFSDGQSIDEAGLASQILHRRSTKEVYDAAYSLSDSELSSLRAAGQIGAHLSIGATQEAQNIAKLRDYVKAAFRIEVDTDRTYLESVQRMRVGNKEIVKHRDGLEMNGPMFAVYGALGLMSEGAQMKKGGIARNKARELIDEMANSTNCFAWIVTNSNSRQAQIDAGKAYVRMNLQAAILGLAMAPWSQILQEFEEMQPLQKQFLQTLQIQESQTVQMLFRLGHAKSVGPTPRRPLDDLVIK